MLRLVTCVFLAFGIANVDAAELSFDFEKTPLNQTPSGFRSTVTGRGQPGVWKVLLEEVPPVIPALTAKAEIPKRHVLAQTSGDITDEHFPLLIYDGEVFGDFTFTTRFKNVSGAIEQMAGLAFRIQDETNYYYVRASSLGNTFRFFKLVNGQRSPPLGPDTQIPKGVWHELTVECQGNRIRCLLNGKEIMPPLTDNTFKAGKVGFWTKSDAIAYFAESKITYTPREPMAQVLVRETLKKYPRLVGLRIYASLPGNSEIKIVASGNPEEFGRPAGIPEQEAVARDAVYFGKIKNTATVTLPLHDRNGETVAAAQVLLESFRGQTEQNAMARALPIVKEIEGRIRSAKDLLE